MKHTIRRVLYSIGLGAGGLLFILQLWNGYQAIVEKSFQITVPVALFAAVGAAIVALGLQMVGWSRLMRGLGAPVRLREVVAGYSLSFLPRYIPGSFWGYMSRGEWLRRSHDIPYRISNLGSVLEVINILTGSCMIWGIYFASRSAGAVQVISALIALGMPVGVWIILRWAQHRQLIRNILRNSWSDDALPKITLRTWLLTIALYILLWLSYGVLIWLLAKATGLVDQVGPFEYTFMYSLAWTVGFLVILAPAGLGIRELTLSGLLVVNTGILTYQGNAISVTSRFIVSMGEMVWVLVGILLSRSFDHNLRIKENAK